MKMQKQEELTKMVNKSIISLAGDTIWYKVNGLFRYILAHTSTQILPLYVVNEYPKSGGSWVGEMLSDAVAIPFPRNRLPMLRSSILHGHMMHSWNMHNVLLVWRDGRDVLISQYYHSLFENDRGNARLVAQCRKDLKFADYEDISGNLLAFMEYVYERKRHPRISWVNFVHRWSGCDRCVHVKYEDMRLRPVDELQRIVGQLAGRVINRGLVEEIVAKHSFERKTGRKAGEENTRSFMRKGIIGDWENYFDQDARERFHAYAGDALIKLGYENSDAWVQQHCDAFIKPKSS